MILCIINGNGRTVEKVLHVLLYLEDVFSMGPIPSESSCFPLLLGFLVSLRMVMSPLCILTSNFQTSVCRMR